jgi:uncharacterized protein (DUF2252 family)
MVRSPIVALLLVAGCASPDAGRRAWLVEQLLRDNAVWWSRDPALFEVKLAAMAADPYDYMRGTAGVFLRDQARAGTDRQATAFLRYAGAGELMLVGDPHPENLGSFLPSDGAADPAASLRLDVSDLDGASFGPWLWDARRAALGLLALVDGAVGCEAGACGAAVEALARGYADAVGRAGRGEAALDLTASGPHGPWLADWFEDIVEDGLERKAYGKDVEGGLLVRDEGLDEDGDGTLALSPSEQVQAAALSRAWLEAAPRGARVLDVARRYGKGVASLPAVRYTFLVDGGSDGPDDDQLLSVREVVDPPAVPGLVRPVDGLFADGVSRVRQASRWLWAHPDADPWLLGLSDGIQAFKVQAADDWNEGIDHDKLREDLAEGKATPGDVEEIGALLGGLLAEAHLRAPTASGRPALEALAAEVEGRGDTLAHELRAGAERDLGTLLADHALFQEALGIWGPSLGLDRVAARGAQP